MAARSAGEDLVLYHRTSLEAAEKIMRERSMLSKENTAEVYLSNRTAGVTDGYGPAVVQLRIPEELAELEDEFPDGEQHYRVRVDALRAEHFVRTWTEHPDAPHEDLRAPTEVAPRTEPAAGHLDQGADDDRVEMSDSAGITPTTSPASRPELASEQPQVDLHLGEAVYRQAAARGGFTPESVAAAEVTIEQAVTTRQAVSTAERLHALADQVATARDNRATKPPVTPPVRAVPVAPSPRVEVVRARAASAQIWDDTRGEYDAPSVAERR